MKTDTVDDTAAGVSEENLTTAITNLLKAHNHPNPEAWLSLVHPDALSNPDRSIQRFLINRFWRNAIGDIPPSDDGTARSRSLDVRYALVDTGEFKDWLRLFESEIIPCILENNLPRILH